MPRVSFSIHNIVHDINAGGKTAKRNKRGSENPIILPMKLMEYKNSGNHDKEIFDPLLRTSQFEIAGNLK
jgi:hypothetical protein